MSERWAIVLGGGGAKGAYEIGVWSAIRELGLCYTVVTGTSVGALNGAFMVLDDYDFALNVWQNMSTSKVIADMPELPVEMGLAEVLGTFAKYMMKNGAVDTSPLESLIKKTADENIIRNSNIDFGIVTVKLPTMEEKAVFVRDLPEGKINDYLLASSSFFPAFHPQKIDGDLYVDGGYANNVPVDLAMTRRDKFDKMLIVNLEAAGVLKQVEPDCSYLYLRSSVDLGRILVFNGDVARRNIKIGYFDTMKAFNRLYGGIYTFSQQEYSNLCKYIDVKIARLPKNIYELLQNQLTDRLSNIVGSRLKNKYENMPTTLNFMVELTAEIFNLRYDKQYTAQEFILELRDSVENSVDEYRSVKRNVSVASIIEAIKNGSINKRVAVIYMANDILENEIHGYNVAEKIHTLMPVELVASIITIAFYLGGRLN